FRATLQNLLSLSRYSRCQLFANAAIARPIYFFLSAPSLIAAYAPAKKPMKLEPIVMIHGGLISDTTPMSMSQACSTAPPIVPPSQKPIQRTGMSVTCRASFIADPKGPVQKYTLERHQA